MRKYLLLTASYNDKKSIKKFLDVISSVLNKENSKFTLIIMDDGSTEDYSGIDSHYIFDLEIIRLNKNHGHQKALAVGIEKILNYDFNSLVLIDSDGEDEPKAINKLIDLHEKNNFKTVVAQRAKRRDGQLFIFLYRIYSFIFFMATFEKLNFGNYMIFSKENVMLFSKKKYFKMHLASTVLRNDKDFVRYKLDKNYRYFGKSKMNFLKLYRHGINSFIPFFYRSTFISSTYIFILLNIINSELIKNILLNIVIHGFLFGLGAFIVSIIFAKIENT